MTLFLLLLLAVWLSGTAQVNATKVLLKGDLELQRVAIVHRHGARKPDGLSNDTICDDTKTGCGYLMWEGFAQLRSLGATLRSWYDDLLPPTYKPKKIKVRTTDVPRTCQSADAFLQGLFADDTEVVSPVYENVDHKYDPLMIPKSWPSMRLHIAATAATQKALLLNYAQSLADTTVLKLIGEETSQYEVCPSDPVECLHQAQDIESSLKAEGKLDDYPTLQKMEDDLNSFVEYENRLRYVFAANDTFVLGAGSLGNILAQEIARHASTLRNKRGSRRLFEYSAHDNTLVPLYITLGENNPTGTGLLPQFGEAIVFEMHQSTVNKSAVYIRAFVGYPPQGPSSKYPYTFSPFPLKCIDMKGTVYTKRPARSSDDGGCPVDDWVRFLNTTRPQGNGDTYCFYNPPDQKLMCPAGENPVEEEQEACRNFRLKCPAEACRGVPNSLLDIEHGLACRSVR